MAFAYGVVLAALHIVLGCHLRRLRLSRWRLLSVLIDTGDFASHGTAPAPLTSVAPPTRHF